MCCFPHFKLSWWIKLMPQSAPPGSATARDLVRPSSWLKELLIRWKSIFWLNGFSFSGFPLLDQDFDGVKQLLAQQFTESSSIKLRSFAEALIGQNYIGTVVKQSEVLLALVTSTTAFTGSDLSFSRELLRFDIAIVVMGVFWIQSPEDGRDISTDDDVLALVSCYSIARPKDELRDSIVGYLLSKCKESNAKLEIKEDFMKVRLNMITQQTWQNL